MALDSTSSANEQAKDLNLFHKLQLKPMIKAQISRKIVSCGISEVIFVSVYYEKYI